MSNRKPSRAGICFRWRNLAWGRLGLQDAPTSLLLQASMVLMPQAWNPQGRALSILLIGSRTAKVTSILGELLW